MASAYRRLGECLLYGSRLVLIGGVDGDAKAQKSLLASARVRSGPTEIVVVEGQVAFGGIVKHIEALYSLESFVFICLQVS